MKQFNLHNIFFVALTCFSASVFSQDSIFFKNQGITSVKIIEVNPYKVKYRYSSDTTDFIYDTDKNLIAYVKYGNGVIDSMKQVPILVTTINTNTANQIVIDDKKLRYNNKAINDRKLKFLIDNCPESETKRSMLKDYRVMKNYGRIQKIYSPIGFGLGGAAIPTSFFILIANVNDSNYDTTERLQTVGAGFLAAAAIMITSGVISTISHRKRVKKRSQIAMSYNEVN